MITNHVMNTSEIFLIAMAIIYIVPYCIWRFCKTDYYAPLVVVQIVTGILLGSGILGALFPGYYEFVFNPAVVQALNGVAWWAVMLFVFIAGIELDLKKAWQYRRESGITAGFALCIPLLFGCAVGLYLLHLNGWVGIGGMPWQFVMGIGMACAVTALPILILFMEKMQILRLPIGQRILRYASLDDIAIWTVLAIVLMDWERIGLQALFMIGFFLISYLYRLLMKNISETDRWYVGLIWLVLCSLAADWAGLHFMVGAFLAGAVTESDWFNQNDMDKLRHHVLLVLMPVFFLSTGVRTNWNLGGTTVFFTAALFLIASVAGKFAGVHAAGKILRWQKGEASIIAWLLQTRALIMIIFANVLLDKNIITNETFTALLLMAVASTMLTTPMVSGKLLSLRAVTLQKE